MTVKVAVSYYSATGTVHALAWAVAEGAASVGAGVRLAQASFPTGSRLGDGPDATALDAARYQGRRLAQVTIRLLGGGHDPVTGNGSAAPDRVSGGLA